MNQQNLKELLRGNSIKKTQIFLDECHADIQQDSSKNECNIKQSS